MRYVPAKPAWAHQVRGLKFMRERHVGALLMAMRTGKTKVVLDRFGELELEGGCHDLLVVAPAGVYRTWPQAAEDHLSDDLRRRLLVHLWEAGQGREAERRQDLFMRNPRGLPRLLLVNIEATSGVRRARDLIKSFLEQRTSWGVYDESTTIRNVDAARARFAVDEVKPRTNYRTILSGLPTPRSPLDAYMQFEYLDSSILGHSSWEGFKTRYTIIRRLPLGPITRLPNGEVARNEDGSPVRRVIPVEAGFRDVPSIRRSIEAHSFRVRLEDCYDMPAKMYSYRDVDFHPEQRRIYEELRDYATAALTEAEEEQGFVTVSNVVTQLLRLHQILCGHVVTEEGTKREVPEQRTDSLLELLEEHDGKSVIWCSYDFSVQRVAAALAKRFGTRVARFWGGNRGTREEEERMFQGDPGCRHMVATPAAGGKGRYWAAADLCVFYSNTANLEDRLQAEERIQAVGKTTSCGYVDMRVRGTVDERWIKALREKKNLSDVITGDEWRAWL